MATTEVEHIWPCTALGMAAADAGEAAAKVHAVDAEAFELAKHACQLLLRAHQRAHRHCPTADTHWPEPVHRALHQLQEAIAETEGPVVAEWAVSRWIHCGRFETVAESVAAERVDAPARLTERAAREARRAELQRAQQQLSARYGGRP